MVISVAQERTDAPPAQPHPGWGVRWLMSLLMSAVAVAAVAAAVIESNSAAESARALNNHRVASQLISSAVGLERSDPVAALKTGLAAYAIDKTRDTADGLAGLELRYPIVATRAGRAVQIAAALHRSIAAVLDDWGTVRIWDTSRPGRPVIAGTITTSGRFPELALAASGQWLALGGDHLRIWNIEDPAAPQLIHDQKLDPGRIVEKMAASTDLLFVADGSHVISAYQVASAGVGRYANVTMPEHSYVTRLAASSDGTRIAAALPSGDVWVWKMALHPTLAGHLTPEQDADADEVTFDGHGHYLITAGQSVNVWNTDSASMKRWGLVGAAVDGGDASALTTDPLTGDVWVATSLGVRQFVPSPLGLEASGMIADARLYPLAFTSDGTSLISAAVGDVEQTWFWSVSDLASRASTVSTTVVSDIATVRDPSRLFTAGDSGVTVFDTSAPHAPAQAFRLAATAGTTGFVLSADGRRAATRDSSSRLRIWDLSDLDNPKPTTVATSAAVYGLTMSRDGRAVYGLTLGDEVLAWDLADFPDKPPGSARTVSSDTDTIALSNDGRLLVALSATTTTAWVWSVGDFRHLRPIAAIPVGAPGFGRSAAFGPNNLLAIRASDATVRLWSLTQPTAPSMLGGPIPVSAGADDVAFTGSNGLIIYGTGSAELVDIADPRLPVRIGAIPGLDATSLTPLDGGGRIAVVEASGAASVWDVGNLTDPAALTRWACSVTSGGLTSAEWAQSIPGQPYRKSCP